MIPDWKVGCCRVMPGVGYLEAFQEDNVAADKLHAVVGDERQEQSAAGYPGHAVHFKEMLEAFRVEDFEYEYRSRNGFRFMG
ncbi:hypothetical protein AWENTII_002281 [Aspergillus wentii]